MYIDTDIPITAEIARRLIRLEGKRIALPVTPLPGQGLADVVFRGSCLNGHTLFAKRPLNHGLWTAQLDMELVSDKLGTPHGVSDLLPIIYSDLPPISHSPHSSASKFKFFGARLSPLMLEPSRRVAPHSPSGYSKAMWHIRPLSFDIHTHEVLISRCPRCNHLLDFLACGGMTQCPRCPGYDFRNEDIRIEEFADPTAIKFVTGLIDPENLNACDNIMHPDLVLEDRGDLFTMCIKIAEYIELREIPKPKKRYNFAIQNGSLETAARAVLNWPEGVIKVMERYEHANRLDVRGNVRDSGLLTRCRLNMSETLFNKMRETHSRYRVGSATASKKCHTKETSRRNSSLEVIRNVKLYREAVRAIGCSALAFYGFLNAGFLSKLNEGRIQVGSSLTDWIGEFRFDDVPVAEGPQTISVVNFVKAAYQGPDDPWPFVLEALRTRSLPFVRESSISRSIRSLYISEISTWTDFIDARRGFSHQDLAIRVTDASFLLNVHIQCIFPIFSSNISFAGVKSFDKLWIKDNELVDKLWIHGEKVSRAALAAKLNSAALPSFRTHRSDVWRARSEAERFIGL